MPAQKGTRKSAVRGAHMGSLSGCQGPGSRNRVGSELPGDLRARDTERPEWRPVCLVDVYPDRLVLTRAGAETLIVGYATSVTLSRPISSVGPVGAQIDCRYEMLPSRSAPGTVQRIAATEKRECCGGLCG